MKVLLINGSPRANGNTACALEEMVTVFAQEPYLSLFMAKHRSVKKISF